MYWLIGIVVWYALAAVVMRQMRPIDSDDGVDAMLRLLFWAISPACFVLFILPWVFARYVLTSRENRKPRTD